VVPDKGLDKVFVFRLDTALGKLVPNDPPWVVTRAGAGPRHAGFHPTKPYAYVLNELDSSMTTYQFDAVAGALKPLQVLPTIPSSYTGDNTAAEIVVAASGRFVYASNRATTASRFLRSTRTAHCRRQAGSLRRAPRRATSGSILPVRSLRGEPGKRHRRALSREPGHRPPHTRRETVKSARLHYCI
jgi:6-phosphogluconolactonase (cycloisomerase 2 family)